MNVAKRIRVAGLFMACLIFFGSAVAGCGRKAPPVPPREPPSQVERKG